MRMRLLLAAGSAATLSAVAVLTVAVTFGLFKATSTTQTDTFSTGKVTLTSAAGANCTVAALLPGASTPPACTLQATYSGSVSAYLGLNVLVETQAGSGGTKLYNPTDSTNDLSITIKDNQGVQVTYTVPTAVTTCPLSAPGGSTCYEIDNELVSKTAFTNASAVTFSTTVSLPSASATGYQGGTAQIIVTAHAVQSGNNNFVGSCTPGSACGTAGNWS